MKKAVFSKFLTDPRSCVTIILFVSFMGPAFAQEQLVTIEQTPREKIIRNHEFNCLDEDTNSQIYDEHGRPLIGEGVNFCREIFLADVADEDLQWYRNVFADEITEFAVNLGVPWGTISPYRFEEIYRTEIDHFGVAMCGGEFRILEDSTAFGDAVSIKADAEIRSSERNQTEAEATTQFLEYIGADEELTRNILEIGILSLGANELFKEAWLSGRLDRPGLVQAYGECGDGEISVNVEYLQPTQRLQIITDFDYQVCELLSLDPWDADECPHVRDRLADVLLLSGRYRARIERTNGQVILRQIRVSHDSEDTIRL